LLHPIPSAAVRRNAKPWREIITQQTPSLAVKDTKTVVPGHQ